MIADSIFFFASREAALALCERGDMTEFDGFFVVEAIGRLGQFVIEVCDPSDGVLLSYL